MTAVLLPLLDWPNAVPEQAEDGSWQVIEPDRYGLVAEGLPSLEAAEAAVAGYYIEWEEA